jgi:hypothetical protein
MSKPENQAPDALMGDLIASMENCPTAEALNDEFIMPFALALEKICAARGYIMNIYGENSNIVISTADDAETIYHLVDEYLDNIQNSPPPKLD